MPAQHITFSGKMTFGEAPGRCIYCGSDGGKDGLRDEHIVAYCLAIDTTLPKATCKKCADVTSYLEGYAGRQIFGPMRIHFKIQSRRKKIELDPVNVLFKSDRGEEVRSIPREQLPPTVTLPLMATPGIFTGSDPAPIGATESWAWIAEDPTERMNKLLKPGDLGWEIRHEVKPIVFARMLAKIAHAVTVGWLGLDSFKPFLPPLILGQDQNAAYLIGGAEPPTEPGPAQPYSDNTLHHKLSVRPMTSPGKPPLLAVSIRLFLHIGSPTYWVVVGEPFPATLERLTVRDAEQAP
jgi:hypothetical protein